MVPRLVDKNAIGTKWVFKNKMNEQGEVIKNKARLVCKGYSHKKELITKKHMHLWQEWKQ